MAGPDIRPITREVLQDLLPRLRPVDRLELDCMTIGDPLDELERMADRARRSCAAYMGGDLVGIFGVSAQSALSDVGCPWALITRAVDLPATRRALVAHSHVGLEWMGQDFRRLWNVVAEENRTAVRWLRWLGFTFDGRAVELRGHRFLHFEKEVSPCE